MALLDRLVFLLVLVPRSSSSLTQGLRSLAATGDGRFLDDSSMVYDNQSESLTSSSMWKTLGEDVWIPDSEVFSSSKSSSFSLPPPPSPPPSSRSSSVAPGPTISLARTNRRLLVVTKGLAYLYDLLVDPKNGMRTWNIVHNSTSAQTSSLPRAGRSFVAAAALSPEGHFMAQQIVSHLGVTSSPVKRHDIGGNIRRATRQGRVSKSRRGTNSEESEDRAAKKATTTATPTEADAASSLTTISTIQVLSITNDGEIGSVSVVSETMLQPQASSCSSSSRLVLKNSFLLVTCPTWSQSRGRVWLYHGTFDASSSSAASWKLIWDIPGDEPGDALGYVGDLDVTSHRGVVRVAMSSPGASGGTGCVRVYDFMSPKEPHGDNRGPTPLFLPPRQVGMDLIGLTRGDDFGTSLSLSETGEGIMAIGSRKGSIYLASFERPLLNGLPSRPHWKVVQEIEIPSGDENHQHSVAGPWSASDRAPLKEVSVFITPDAQRLVILSSQFETFSSGRFDQAHVYEKVVNGSGANQWIRRASMYLSHSDGIGANAVWATSGYGIAIMSSQSCRDASDSDGATQKRVRVLLDYTPFCGIPVAWDVDPFLERQQCRTGLKVAAERPNACKSLSASDDSLPCTWVSDAPENLSSAPTVSPINRTLSPSTYGLPPTVNPISNRSSLIPLTSCVCDDGLACVTGPTQVDRDFRFCIRGGHDRVKLERVTTLYLQQDRIRYFVLDEGGVRIGGVSSRCSESLCYVVVPHGKLELLTKGELSLLAAGTAVFTELTDNVDSHEIGDSDGKRDGRRPLGTESRTQGFFSVVIPLPTICGEHETVTVSFVGGFHACFAFWTLLVITILLSFVCCKCALKGKEKNRNDAVQGSGSSSERRTH